MARKYLKRISLIRKMKANSLLVALLAVKAAGAADFSGGA
jgi:hypothetical protein